MKIFNKKGFTLIELLVVISIIGVLAMIIVPNLVGMRERARDAKKKSELVQLKKALRLYYNDNQSYPAASSGDINGASPATEFTNTAGDVVYMNEVPEYDSYTVSGDGEEFTLSIELENAADPDLATSQTKCGGSGLEYVVCQDQSLGISSPTTN